MNAKEERRKSKKRFAVASRIEKEYSRQLKHVVNQIDHFVKVLGGDSRTLQETLNKYSELITPWAESVANKIVTRIMDKDLSAWVQLGREMNLELKKELDDSPIGFTFKKFMEEQVVLIKSLPMEAGYRVHKLTIEGMAEGRRAEDIMKDILKTGSVTESRAHLIARTEVARTASALVKARSEHIGVTHYKWMTSNDADVRETHKAMNGKIIAWDSPPEVEPGKFYHAGMFPNCRCWPYPILTDD